MPVDASNDAAKGSKQLYAAVFLDTQRRDPVGKSSGDTPNADGTTMKPSRSRSRYMRRCQPEGMYPAFFQLPQHPGVTPQRAAI